MTTSSVTRVRFAALLLFVLFTGLALATPAPAQDVRLLSTKVADLLAQFPARDLAHRDKLADEMIATGPAGLAEFAKKLVPAGAGDDIAVRWALDGMAQRAGQPGQEAKRLVAEKALVAALGTATDVEVKTFLLAELLFVGREPAVKAAASLLADAALVEPAAQLLLSVKSLAARAALVAAFPKASGPAQLTIVRALGQLKAVESHDAIVKLAKDPNPELRRNVLIALAAIASPRSYATLAAAAKAAEYRYETSHAMSALLEYARQLGKKGQLVTADKVCRLVMANTDGADQLADKGAALSILAANHGAAAMPDLLTAVDHGDTKYRNTALLAAEGIKTAATVKQWITKAGKVDATRKAEIVAMLGRQGHATALPFLRTSLGAPEPDVKLAAAEALAHLEKGKAAGDLVAQLKTADAATATQLAAILQWTIDEKGLDPVAAMLDTLPVPARAAAITLIGNKGGRRFGAKIIPLVSDSDASIRTAALGALAGVVGAADLPKMIAMLDAAPDSTAAAPLQKAVSAAVLQVTPETARAKPLLDAIKVSPHPGRLVEVLPQAGGADALAAVVSAFETGAPPAKAAAFRALTQWRGPEAAERLFAVYVGGDEMYRQQAFVGFTRLIGASNLPDDQKVLQFRRVLAKATTGMERRALLRAFERVKTFQSLLAVMPFLDAEDKELAADAAGTVAAIALPATGAREGLSGAVVRSALTKVVAMLSGSESEYERERVRTYLNAMSPGAGFVPMFNGKDLTGWKGLVGSPLTRAKLSAADLATKQAEADAKIAASWSVRDGMIVFNGTGDNLCSTKDYGDFEMVVDWRITKGGDSGIYLRGSPQVQIWDPARTDVGAEVGSGGLYNNKRHAAKPLVFADNPVGEWNTFRIRMIGDKVTVFLNGIKVVDNVTMENYWDREQPIFAKGAIELQAHGTDLAFRDIYVRELSGGDAQLSAEEKAAGFVSMFDGHTLEGWTGNTTGYKAQDGVIVYDSSVGGKTNLYTAKEYADYQFRFEFQLQPGTNNGIGIRTPKDGDAAYVGMEVQVLDDTASMYAQLQPYQYHGSVYGIFPAKRGALKPVGEWNEEEIMVQGSKIKVTLNGTVIVEGDLADALKKGTLDKHEHPGASRTSGYIAFLSHDSPVRYRKLRIRELK